MKGLSYSVNVVAVPVEQYVSTVLNAAQIERRTIGGYISYRMHSLEVRCRRMRTTPRGRLVAVVVPSWPLEAVIKAAIIIPPICAAMTRTSWKCTTTMWSRPTRPTRSG